jgi:hypothetical protein
MEYVPEDIKPETIEIIEWDSIQKGDYIMFYNKRFKYMKKDPASEEERIVEPKFNRGGFVAEKIESELGEFLMMVNPYGCKWSVQRSNVKYFYKSLIQKRGGRKKKMVEECEKESACENQQTIEKKKRGRPKKSEVVNEVPEVLPQEVAPRKRGRPVSTVNVQKRPRGRPKKIQVDVDVKM